mmetsp:Transcript_5636/g.19155  ORF Transcript_5636/g.19155 Transcript_5636/m.19155 type:complete len:272 (-) Transcript_5636:356-1171(-)
MSEGPGESLPAQLARARRPAGRPRLRTTSRRPAGAAVSGLRGAGTGGCLKVLEERLVAGVDGHAPLLVGVRVLVEVGGVVLALHLRDDGRGHLARKELVPVEAGEPLVLLDVRRAVLEVADALGQVRGEELLDEVLGVAVEVPRELDLALQDLLVDAQWVLVVEGRVPREHLEDEDARGPPVHRLAVPLAQDDLRGEVLRGAAQRPCPVLHLLGKAKVSDLDVPLGVEEQVLRLEVPIDHRHGVQVLEGEHDLRRVEARRVVWEAPSLAEV